MSFSFASKTDEELEVLYGKKFSILHILVLVVLAATSLFIGEPELALFPIILYGSYFFALSRYISQRRFMREFASKHNLTYSPSLALSALSARLFKHSNGNISHVLSGTYNSFPIKFFNYSYSIQRGKSRVMYSFTVCEVTIQDAKFPHLFLQMNAMQRHQAKDYFGYDKDVSVPLEGQFQSKYSLYTTKSYEIEAVQICDARFLELVATMFLPVSIEWAEDKIYFYSDLILPPDLMERLYTGVASILDARGAFIMRMRDDYAVMHEAFKKDVPKT